MQRIVDLLKEKNRLLRKFYTLNKAELFRLNEGDYNNVDRFYRARDGILDIINHIDKRIEELLKELAPPQVISPDLRKGVEALLSEKEELIQEVLDQDLRILSFIETEKNRMIVELNTVRKNRVAFSAYGGRKP